MILMPLKQFHRPFDEFYEGRYEDERGMLQKWALWPLSLEGQPPRYKVDFPAKCLCRVLHKRGGSPPITFRDKLTLYLYYCSPRLLPFRQRETGPFLLPVP